MNSTDLRTSFCCIGLFYLLVISQISVAQEDAGVFQEFEELKNAKSVSVSLRSPKTGGKPYQWVKENPKYECAISHSSPKKIKELVAMLQEFIVKSPLPANYSTIYTEIYFEFADENEVQILLSRIHTTSKVIDGKWVKGSFISGKINFPESDEKIAFNANVDLYDSLRNWAKDDTPIISENRINELVPDQNNLLARENYRKWLLRSCELWTYN